MRQTMENFLAREVIGLKFMCTYFISALWCHAWECGSPWFIVAKPNPSLTDMNHVQLWTINLTTKQWHRRVFTCILCDINLYELFQSLK